MKAGFGRRLRKIQPLVVMVVIVLVFMGPVIHGLIRSVSPPGGLGNYAMVLSDPSLVRYFANSVVYSVSAIALNVICASLAGFALSQLSFPLSNVIYLVLLSALLIPGSALMVPQFLLIRALGLYNTTLALILPNAAFGVPFYTVLIRNYLDGLPSELVDAARIDGASYFQVFWRIMLPLSVPIQTVVVTLSFLGSWNDFLSPMIMLRDEELRTMAVAVVTWANRAGKARSVAAMVNYDTLFAALFVLAAPSVVVFLLLQRRFMEAMTLGALKG